MWMDKADNTSTPYLANPHKPRKASVTCPFATKPYTIRTTLHMTQVLTHAPRAAGAGVPHNEVPVLQLPVRLKGRAELLVAQLHACVCVCVHSCV